MFPFSSPSQKDLPLFNVHHRPFPSPHPQKKRRKWDEGANVWRQWQMQPSNILKNYIVKCLVSSGCFSLLLKAHSLKDCCILASTHTPQKKKKVLLFVYFCVCECGIVDNSGILILWYETKQYKNTWNTKGLFIWRFLVSLFKMMWKLYFKKCYENTCLQYS